MWDVFAVSTYFTISLLFWFLGLIPDLAALRDSSPQQAAASWSTAIFALGWRGSAPALAPSTSAAYLLLAGLVHAAGALGAHDRVLRLRDLACCPAGTPPSSRPTSSPAPSSPASRWCCTLDDPGAALPGPQARRSPRRHLENMAKVMLAHRA